MNANLRDRADASALPRFVARASAAPVGRIRDVVLVPTTHVEGDFRDQQPADRVELAANLTLERLADDDAELVLNACTPRGHFFVPVRQFGQRYAFLLEVDPGVYGDRPYHWDEEGLLYAAVVLSRLVHDNGCSLRYAARIVDHEDGAQQVIPVSTQISTHTYGLRNDRDWLTADEANALRELIATWLPVKDNLPWPVSHGLNIGEDAVHLRIIQRALLLIAAGLEGLVQSSSQKVSRQFSERLPMLAAEVGVAGVDEAFAKALYTARSEAAHGAPVGMFQPRLEPEAEAGEPDIPEGEPDAPAPEADAARKVALAQDLLRAAVRRAIEDEVFRAVFVSARAISRKWPVNLNDDKVAN